MVWLKRLDSMKDLNYTSFGFPHSHHCHHSHPFSSSSSSLQQQQMTLSANDSSRNLPNGMNIGNAEPKNTNMEHRR